MLTSKDIKVISKEEELWQEMVEKAETQIEDLDKSLRLARPLLEFYKSKLKEAQADPDYIG